MPTLRSLLLIATLAPTCSALHAAALPRSAALAPRLAVAPALRRLSATVRMDADAISVPSPPKAPPSPSAAQAKPTAFQSFSNTFSTLFPLWTALVALLGLYRPQTLASIPTSAFTGLLGMLMLSMGITLTLDDFKRVLTRPGVMVVGFLGCYVFMPILALGLAKAFALSPALTAGMVLVGSINGGQV